jgi:hypothetical protein
MRSRRTQERTAAMGGVELAAHNFEKRDSASNQSGPLTLKKA